MRHNKYRSVIAGLAALALLARCEKQPDVIISFTEPVAQVYGAPNPDSIDVRVRLVQGADTVSSTTYRAGAGFFVFHNVPYGEYECIATAKSDLCGRMYVFVDKPHVSLSRLELFSGDGYVWWSPGETTLRPRHAYSLDSIRLHVECRTRARFAPQPLSIAPAKLGMDAAMTVSRYRKRCVASFPIDSLFRQDSLRLVIRYVVAGVDGAAERLDSATHVFAIDSAGLDSTLTARMIAHIGDGTRYYWKKAENEPARLEQFNPEGDIRIVFARAMNWQTVEENVSVQPAVPFTCFWSSDTLRISPARFLHHDTVYTVTIGTGAMSLDSARFRRPYSFEVHPRRESFFNAYWPLDGAVGVNCSSPLRFSCTYAVDTAAFRDAFSIEPAPDSLSIDSSDESWIQMRHTGLLPGTDYTMRIDKSLRSRKGIPLENDLVISFSTVAQ
jgi:hypothetical protein